MNVKTDRYELVAEGWSRGGAWGHRCRIYKDATKIMSPVSIRYWNRTWESYRFETVLSMAVDKLEEYCLNNLKKQFLLRNGYKRMTEQRRIEFNASINDNEDLEDVAKLKSKI